MFNLRRVVTFWWHILRVLIPFYVVIAGVMWAVVRLNQEVEGAWQMGLMVVVGLITPTLAIAAAFGVATAFMRALYKPQRGRDPFWHLVHCMFGQASFKPWLIVEKAKINTEFTDPNAFIVQVGGPGNLVVRKDSAVVFEQAGILTRVEGPGFPHLGPFERVYDIIDLRPRRWQFAVSGMSKEGIPVTCNTDLEFQIRSGSLKPTEERPFPMNPASVFRASTCKWMREKNRPKNDQMLDWRGLIVISRTEGQLRSILARYPLDRLIAPLQGSPKDAEHPREIIRRELDAFLSGFAPEVGARMIKVELGKIEVDDEVTQQWIESWRANWVNWEAEYLAAADARYTEEVGAAKSEAVAQRIGATASILSELARLNRAAFVKGALIQLHLALRNVGSDSLALTYLPSEATNLLQDTLKKKP